MNKCFITKLPSSVDNDNLPVLGQLRIDWLKQDALSKNAQRGLWLSTNDSITVKVSGAHFTDETLTSNLGNTKTITAADGLVALYVSNDADAILTIDNKYSLTALQTTSSPLDGLSLHSISFDIDDIRYCTNLTSLILTSPQVIGNIDAVSKLINLTSLNLLKTQVNGDIKAISGLTKLVYLIIDYTSVSGDIKALSNLTNIKKLGFNETQVSGDISAISNLTNLNLISFENTQVSGDIKAVSNLTNLYYLSLNQTNITGNISAISGLTKLATICLDHLPLSGTVDSFANLTNLTDLRLIRGSSLTGDMSKIPANVKVISASSRKVDTNFTWTAKGRQNATLLAMDGHIPFDTVSMDNMFIDQATCTFKGIDSQPYTKIISVSGTRTSASDAAVAAIQNMGVTITGVTKQA